MAPHQLDATVRYLPGVAVIGLRGEIDSFAEQTLEAAYANALKTRPAAIVVNFGGVDYINSTGIALIVSLMSRARGAGCRLIACGLSDHYQEIFSITRLADYMPVYADEVSALASEMTPAL